jgi:hypothetical protein
VSKDKHGSSVLRSTGGLQHAQSGARPGRAHPPTVPLRAQLARHVCALLGLCSCGAARVRREWQMCCSEPPYSECVHCFACSNRSTIHASDWIRCHGIAHALAVLELPRCDQCGLRARVSSKCQREHAFAKTSRVISPAKGREAVSFGSARATMIISMPVSLCRTPMVIGFGRRGASRAAAPKQRGLEKWLPPSAEVCDPTR